MDPFDDYVAGYVCPQHNLPYEQPGWDCERCKNEKRAAEAALAAEDDDDDDEAGGLELTVEDLPALEALIAEYERQKLNGDAR
jgi:hypothetical protein